MGSTKAVFITGTSNIVVPGNKLTYPPAFHGKSRLRYYSSFFNSLEINSSFYKIPMASTFEKWAQDVPGDFRFSVKIPKEVTHAKELKGDIGAIEKLMNAADKIGDKKGCLLLQFPGKITVDYFNDVENILDKIRQSDKRNEWKIAVEFRHASWYMAETFELMDDYHASVVLHDIPKGKNSELGKSAGFVFIRFHGPAGDYRGSYSKEQLKAYAIKIKSWLKQGKDVYAYFNNTMGSAFENAIDLQAMIKNKR